MALATFSDLTAAIASWLDREDADFAARVPDFIALAEQRVNYGGTTESPLRVAEMEAVAEGMADEDGFASLPDDYLELRAVYFNDLAAESRTYEEGPCDGYTIVGNQIRVPPTAAGLVTIAYYARIPPLSDANPTNWLLRKAPGAYLYGALLEAAPFEQDDARMQTWLALYTSALAGLRATDIGARYGNGIARVSGCRP